MKSLKELVESLHNASPEDIQNGTAIITEAEVRHIARKVREVLIEENNVQPVPLPVVIAGDIHGQFPDLLELFRVGGQPPETAYIFLGDYVDRGPNSVECFMLLVLYKILYPSRVTLLRGNHESRHITQVYGFYDECLRKYGSVNVWRLCTELFDYLTLAAVVKGTVFCVHGGLSPEVRLIDKLRTIYRAREVPHVGAFGDMVWSDPDPHIEGWALNPRGAGWLFGSRVAEEFCHLNDISLIARAHQLALEGYQHYFPTKNLVTVWSAPNYCKRCGNVGAIMKLDEDCEASFTIFHEVELPQRRNYDPKFVARYFL